MSAGADPVVIVSAARTAVGECPSGSLRPVTLLPDGFGETRALATRRGAAGHGPHSPGAPRLSRGPAPRAAIGSSQ